MRNIILIIPGPDTFDKQNLGMSCTSGLLEWLSKIVLVLSRKRTLNAQSGRNTLSPRDSPSDLVSLPSVSTPKEWKRKGFDSVNE